jgi:hypothetical protein
MNVVNVLTSASDVFDFVHGLWKTDAFRDAHRRGGFVQDIVNQFVALPRLFCQATNDRLERAHFSTWWGGMMLRDDYANPVIADLYLLHELYHAATMPYIPGLGRAAFDEKMVRNELEASVLSEIQVYFEMPELRAASFDHPIYADRYLNDPYMQMLWRDNKPVAIETLRAIRRNVMIGMPEHEMDATELWIRRFAQQNAAYSIVWADHYDLVERRMRDFQLDTHSKSRQEALLRHRDWLEAEAGKDAADHVPFRRQAELSTAFYWYNKEKHQEAMQAEGKRQRVAMAKPARMRKA